MKKRKLKGYVLPTLYLLITITVFVGVLFLGKDINFSNTNYDYGTDIFEDNINSVVSEDNTISSNILAPVTEGTAQIAIFYYDNNDDDLKQQESLIYYENTYLPNTGLLYASDNEFEVKTTFDGKVVEIVDDEFFGKCVVVEHASNLRTYYYGLKDIEVSVGDEITTGTVLGISQNNEIMNNKKTFLLEVYYDNELLDPESFIGTKITDYKTN